ncbi:antitoxin YobK [Clostridium zeae]|uniref:Antitoxin YobK n=1 Tax=Clostridium zeae TaxID=2759022 RepID=A0ABQ1E6J9_9CLOT|nr:SMI1/KNR4 family protein [Clostridium zeae]GFZ30402.1 antitoxin YobK [Clostridium zeae]
MIHIREKIEDLIATYYDEGFFLGSIDESLIDETEIKLDVTLPDSYKWYIKTYGCGGIGFDIIGVGRDGHLPVVSSTEKYRSYGMPIGLIVIQDIGEWVYCLDTNRMSKCECPVVTWSMHDRDGIIFRNNNFYEYLLDSLKEAIDNL